MRQTFKLQENTMSPASLHWPVDLVRLFLPNVLSGRSVTRSSRSMGERWLEPIGPQSQISWPSMGR